MFKLSTSFASLACAACLASVAHAAQAASQQDDFTWSAQCKTATGHFAVRFHSPSGDPSNDDMQVSIRQGKSATRVTHLNPGLFYGKSDEDSITGLCDDIWGTGLADGNILLLFRRDNRPGADHLAAILLDRQARHVIDVADDLGEINAGSAMHQEDGATQIRMIREWAPLQKDQEDQPIDGWMVLSDDGGKIRWKWRDPE